MPRCSLFMCGGYHCITCFKSKVWSNYACYSYTDLRCLNQPKISARVLVNELEKDQKLAVRLLAVSHAYTEYSLRIKILVVIDFFLQL
jgi:hypothetical protein